MKQHFLYLDMHPKLWTQPLQHCGNSKYYLHFSSLISNVLVIFVALFYIYIWTLNSQHSLFNIMSTENITLSFWVFFSDFLPIFSWFLYLDIDPERWTQPLPLYMATVGNATFHLFFTKFLVIFLHCTSVFLLRVKASRGVERWINESMNQWMKNLPKSSVDKEWVLLVNS